MTYHIGLLMCYPIDNKYLAGILFVHLMTKYKRYGRQQIKERPA